MHWAPRPASNYLVLSYKKILELFRFPPKLLVLSAFSATDQWLDLLKIQPTPLSLFMFSPEYRQELGFCPELVAMLETGVVHTQSDGQTGLHSASTLNNLVLLKRLFTQQRALTTLEIGLGYGASCALFTACHRAAGAAPSKQHVGIDPFQTSQWKDATPTLLKSAGLAEYADILRRLSCLELPELVAAGRKFELIYIDGSHLFEDVFVDFYFCRQLLSPRGIVAFDDCASAHIAKVLKYITTSLSEQFEELDVSPLRLDGGQPLKYKLARKLGKTQFRAFRLIGAPDRPIHSPFVNF